MQQLLASIEGRMVYPIGGMSSLHRQIRRNVVFAQTSERTDPWIVKPLREAAVSDDTTMSKRALFPL
jgi:hypothetical protein